MKSLPVFLGVLAWLAFTKTPRAQTTDVGGVINQYTEVLGIAPTGCYTNINVANGSFFSVGDTVLIIQMKGATLDLSNTPSFGTVIDYDNAGNYEFAIVDGVSGNTVSVGALTNAYSISGSVQLVTVPVYANANVTSTLTATAWNGAAAGVLVFIVNGTLTLNADIDLTAKGFRGGDVSNNPDGGCGAGSPDFFYPLSPGGTGSWTEGGAMKGEGIGSVPANMLAGKGKQANGGGGGNKHNTGGGGGGNFTSGGKGGNEMVGCVQSGNGGLGGDAVPSLPTKVYLGGGGGCGDYNNNVGTNGADGGGIALIKANEIVGNGFTIKSNGEAHVTVPNGIGDGEGGGGAGGSIYMAVTNYTGALLVQTNGSNGGNQNSTYGCFGPGGGGGSGIVGVSVSLPANVAVEMNAGLAGINVNPALPCYNTTYGATDADQNTSGPMAGVAFVFPTPSTNPALLNLGPDTVVCAGSAVMFDATVLGATYVWNDGSTAATLAASSPGIYSVTVTTASCGVLFDTIDVAHEPYPVVDLGNDTSLCPSTTFELNAFQSDVTFLWQDGSTDATFTITNPSVYGVTVTSLFGCSTSDDVQIEYETAVLINIGPDTVICSAQSYQLTAAGNGASFLWQDGSTGSTIAATSSGLYTVTAYSPTGCAAADSAMVSFVEPVVFSLGNDTVLCDGESFYLQLNIADATFLWHDGTTANDITITENEVVSVEVFQSPCPGVTDSVVVTFTPLPPLELGNDTSICVFDSLSFNVSSPGAAFVWHDGSTDAFHDVTGSGWYSVTATAGGCAASDSAYAAVMDTPVATLGSDTTLCNGRGLVLGPLLPAGAFEWNDNSTDSIKEVSGTGLYMVTVTTACGSDADTIDVRFAECSCEVFVPNLFTPNNDGVNDRLKSYFACPVSDYRWTLFDRWGERVFESTNPEETWDGFFRGRAASPGVYAWILSFTEQRAILEPHRQILEGNTTLLR